METRTAEELEAKVAALEEAIAKERSRVRELEAGLHESEERLSIFEEGLRDHARLELDTSGRISGWSEAAERFLGYTQHEVFGQPFAILFAPEDVRNHVPDKELEAARVHGHSFDQAWLMRKNGERVWAAGFIVARPARHGPGMQFVKIFKEQKRVEEALRESEHRLRLALEGARMAIWRWHISSGQLDVDQNLYHLFGISPDDSIHTYGEFSNAIHPADRKGLAAAFHRSLRESGKLDVEFRVVWPDNSIHWLKNQGAIFTDRHSRPLYMTGVCVDITEHKQLEEGAQRRAAELAEEDRRKDDFLAMLGHELRNPLAPIRNAAQILRMQTLPGAECDRPIAMIERQVEHMTRLVDDLLEVSRVTRGKVHLQREHLDLHVVVDRAVEMSRPLFEARRQLLHVSFPPTPIHVEGDAIRLSQVIGNLLNNAAKYSEEQREIWVTGSVEGKQAVLRVRDQGMGISAEMLPRVFEPFAQASRSLDRSQGGLGLGLTLVKRLVELHHGTVEAFSLGLGHGSEFVVRFPLHELAGDDDAPSDQMPLTSGRRVLVVDDNADAAESAAMLLRLMGHDVATAPNGPAGLSLAEQFHPEIILLDIGLPGMDGYQVVPRLRQIENGDRMLIVALTGYGQEEDRERCRQAGFDHHLVKPVAIKDLEMVLSSTKP